MLLMFLPRNRRAVFPCSDWSRTLKPRHVSRLCVGQKEGWVTLGSPYLCGDPAGLTALLLAAASHRGPLQGPRVLLRGLVLPGHQPWHLGHLCLGLHSCKGNQPRPQVRKFKPRFIHSSSCTFFYACQHSFIHIGTWILIVQPSESDRPELLDPIPPAYSESVTSTSWGMVRCYKMKGFM